MINNFFTDFKKIYKKKKKNTNFKKNSVIQYFARKTSFLLGKLK
jgi:hypothetical protein